MNGIRVPTNWRSDAWKSGQAASVCVSSMTAGTLTCLCWNCQRPVSCYGRRSSPSARQARATSPASSPSSTTIARSLVLILQVLQESFQVDLKLISLQGGNLSLNPSSVTSAGTSFRFWLVILNQHVTASSSTRTISSTSTSPRPPSNSSVWSKTTGWKTTTAKRKKRKTVQMLPEGRPSGTGHPSFRSHCTTPPEAYWNFKRKRSVCCRIQIHLPVRLKYPAPAGISVSRAMWCPLVLKTAQNCATTTATNCRHVNWSSKSTAGRNSIPFPSIESESSSALLPYVLKVYRCVPSYCDSSQSFI